MKSKGKIIGFLILVVVICAMIFLAFKIGVNNETLGDTGWTLDQFIKWAEKVQPCPFFIDTPARISYTAFSGQRNNTIQDLIGRT